MSGMRRKDASVRAADGAPAFFSAFPLHVAAVRAFQQRSCAPSVRRHAVERRRRLRPRRLREDFRSALLSGGAERAGCH
jgi:hypothetical protein